MGIAFDFVDSAKKLFLISPFSISDFLSATHLDEIDAERDQELDKLYYGQPTGTYHQSHCSTKVRCNIHNALIILNPGSSMRATHIIWLIGFLASCSSTQWVVDICSNQGFLCKRFTDHHVVLWDLRGPATSQEPALSFNWFKVRQSSIIFTLIFRSHARKLESYRLADCSFREKLLITLY